MKEIERRVVSRKVEMRDAGEGKRTLDGYGAVFNLETVIGGGTWGFRERILPGAFADSILKDDVRGLFNHDANVVLGRNTNGTLHLEEDGIGLRYVIDLNPDDPDAVRVAAKIQRGDVSQSSFAFSVLEEDGDEWDFTEVKLGKLPLRTIKRAELYDVSPVTYPAYPQTSVSARAQHLGATPDPAAARAKEPPVVVVRADGDGVVVDAATRTLIDVAHRDLIAAHHSARAAIAALGVTGVPDSEEEPLTDPGGTGRSSGSDAGSAMYYAGHAMRHAVGAAVHAATHIRAMCRDAADDGSDDTTANAATLVDVDLRKKSLELERLR